MKRYTPVAICVLCVSASLLFVAFGRDDRSMKPAETPALLSEPSSEPAPAPETRDSGRDRLVPSRNAPLAPALAAGAWINSEPLEVEKLRGRVVLIEFWTFGCYNCRHTLPAVKRWHERYRNRGLTIIGVHSPEFDHEKVESNVRREVQSLGIRYPVVTDNDYATWRAYGIEAWPTTLVIDKQGRIRWTHIGEGMYDETENVIRKLLAEQA